MSELAGPITVSYPPAAPPGTAAKLLVADSPLVLNNSNSPHSYEYTITSGKTLRVQRVFISSSKDPSEKGARVELIFKDATEHVFERYYAADVSLQPVQYSDRKTARDGTAMTGNGTNKFIIRRTRLSSPDQEVDVVVEAYEE